MRKDYGELWRRFKLHGDADAREALILAYTPLVKHIVDRMNISPMSYMDHDDLLTHAIIGLIDAIEKCDYDRYEQFEAYARTRIRGAVIDGIREMDWVPRVTRRAANRVESVRAQLTASLGREAMPEEIAEAMNMDTDRVQGVLAEVQLGGMLSLDDPMATGEDDAVTLLDIVPHPGSPNPAASVDALTRKEALARAIDRLGPDERLVITLYYYEDLTLKEIGRIIERTEARVCQIHKAALRKIQAHLLNEEEIFAA